MPKELTIFGTAERDGKDPIFCYALVRDVRGRGEYPTPLLPKNVCPDAAILYAIEGHSELALISWSVLLTEPEAEAVLKSLREGKFSLPKECQIEQGKELSGSCCEPVILEEKNNHWVRTCGTGLLWCRSLVIEKAVDLVNNQLAQWVGPGRAPDALAKVISLIAQHSGLKDVFLSERRIGLVDHFYRTEADLHSFGPLVRVVPQKPDFRRRGPMTTCSVQREFARSDRAFDLHVSISNFDEKLDECLVKFPAGQDQVVITAKSHITDIVLHAFNPDGTLAQILTGAFTQGFEFGISAQGASDVLPPVFKGAPNSEDLIKRPRISTLTTKGPAAGPRSGAFDALRGNREKIAALIGREPSPSPECRWFERDSEEQIAVIRWIKSKLEKPGTRKAILVDPFLGNDALQRVVIRQGNDSIELTILISPGDVDPDAEVANTKATSKHSDKLAASAKALSDQLCGHVSIFDIQRGDGSRQAFHDRYLGIINERGIPTFYLLSNSLSKAAGDWPFAINELDQITSHRVHYYVQQLLAGTDGDRELKLIEVFKRAPAKSNENDHAAPSSNDSSRPTWAAAADAFIGRLIHASARKVNGGNEIEDEVDGFVKDYPSGVNANAIAAAIYENLSYHEENIVRIATRFYNSSHPEIAAKLNELLLDGFFDNLPAGIEKSNCQWLFGRQRFEVFRHLASIISQQARPTDLIRDKLNPVVETVIRAIETQRDDRAFELIHVATCLLAIGLEVAIVTEAADRRYREGLASDYVHWSGRLMRAADTQIRYDGGEGIPDLWREDIAYLASRIVSARATIGDMLTAAIGRVLHDELLLEHFKSLIGTAPPKAEG